MSKEIFFESEDNQHRFYVTKDYASAYMFAKQFRGNMIYFKGYWKIRI